jgi:hypothetical protein
MVLFLEISVSDMLVRRAADGDVTSNMMCADQHVRRAADGVS